jgi:Protein of unknown function (DUF4197)
MKKITFTLLAILFSISAGFSQFGKMLDKAKSEANKVVNKEDNTSLGLKEALNKGVETAVGQLSLENGYFSSPYKILIPEDAQKVINVVKKVPGFEDVETKLIDKMNKAAEIAVKKATPIFIDVIKNMSIKDASNILFGNKDAATRYLETTSRVSLYKAFLPVIQASLDEVNARTYWKTVVDAYNKIPFQKKLNPDLDDHVNNKGLDGLFSLIQRKEEGIRVDVDQRTSPLLKEVFGKLK